MNNQYFTLKVKPVCSHIVVLSLNRPALCNAISYQMMQELKSFWSDVSFHKNVRVVIITGEGNKAFCAGADLKERATLTVATWREQHAVLQQAMRLMSDCPVPVIAAVNGVAYGGGLELALAADFAYACDGATFSQSEVKLGIMPGAMGTQNLSRAVGLRRAKELSFTGNSFSAQEALEWGVVSKVVSADELMQSALETAKTICSNAPLAVASVKKAVNYSWSHSLDMGYTREVDLYNPLLETSDRVEGINAFNEKRIAEFKGE